MQEFRADGDLDPRSMPTGPSIWPWRKLRDRVEVNPRSPPKPNSDPVMSFHRWLEMLIQASGNRTQRSSLLPRSF